MYFVKRHAWDLISFLVAFLLVLGITAVVHAADSKTVLLDFYSDWCGPCRAMKPTVDALATAGYNVQRINVDRQKSLAVKFGIERVPCFVAVAEGQETDRIVGSCSYQRLEAMITRRVRVPLAKPVPPSVISNLKSEIRNPKSPRPAWRYERPVSHRAAVVRIYCQNNAATRSIGSGALVRWNGRVVVLTARHVIQGAQKIIVELCTRRTHWAKVVKVDAVWDCAVLELVGAPEGVEPVDVELGDEAMQRQGDRLESCGYGPDGKLACNTGLFQGYRRSAATPQGPDDWLVISGHARGGDSGGPVFNRRGRLVGVLWGTDGREVVCVQAGRLHRLLDEAVIGIGTRGEGRGVRGEKAEDASEIQNVKSEITNPLSLSAFQRTPTPAKQPEMDRARQECLQNLFGGRRQPATAPNVIVQTDPEVRRILGNIDGKVGFLIEQRRPNQEVVKADANQPSPLVAGLCIIGAVVAGFVIYFSTQK